MASFAKTMIYSDDARMSDAIRPMVDVKSNDPSRYVIQTMPVENRLS